MHPKTKLYLLVLVGVTMLAGIVLIAAAQFTPGWRTRLHAAGVAMTGAAMGSGVAIVFA